MLRRSLVASLAAAVISACPMVAVAAEPAGKSEPIGRVTAAFGSGIADTAAGSRKIDLQSLINNDERITTDGGGMTVLLASRVVLKIDAKTAVTVFEGPTQTNIRVEHGTVHIFVGKRPAATGPVCAGDANGCVETGEGVFLISSNPQTKESYFASEHGSVSLQPTAMASDGKMDHSKHVVMLSANQQAIMRDGQIVSNGELDRIAFNQNTKSLGRLEQAQVTQGAQTFRLRSRALDTESALTQLSAAGWITRETLPAGTSSGSSQPGETKVGSSNNSKKGSSGSGKTTGGTQTAVANKTTPPADAAPAQQNPAGGNTAVQPTQPVPVATPLSPAETAVAASPSATPAPIANPAGVVPTSPAASAAPPVVAPPVVQTPVVEVPVDLAVDVPKTDTPVFNTPAVATPAAGQLAALPAAADLGNASHSISLPDVADIGSAKGNDKKVDKLDKIDKIDLGDVTETGGSKGPVITPAVAPPTIDLAVQTPTIQTPLAPPIDLDIDKGNKGPGKALSKVDKSIKPIDIMPAKDTAAVVAPPIQIDTPKIEIAAPPKIDILPPVAVDVPKLDAPKIDVAPKIEAPKIDVVSVDIAPPKVDVLPKLDPPKIDIAPKVDAVVPKVEVALPKIDLDIKPPVEVVPTPTVIVPPAPTVPEAPVVAPIVPPVTTIAPPVIDTAPKDVTIIPTAPEIKVEIGDVKSITDTVVKDVTTADPKKTK